MPPAPQRIFESILTLSPDDQQQVWELVVALKRKRDRRQPPTESFLEIAKDCIGSIEGPGDLSTNVRYLKGYGS